MPQSKLSKILLNNISYICTNEINMSEQGTIGISITLPIDLYKRMEKLRTKDKLDRSRFIQTSIRRHIKRVEKEELRLLSEIISPKDLEYLINEIKKRG